MEYLIGYLGIGLGTLIFARLFGGLFSDGEPNWKDFTLTSAIWWILFWPLRVMWAIFSQ
jgi:hypothetical protein